MSDTAIKDDLSALAWVHGELRRSLETAHKALRRYLKEAEAASGSDVDAVDPAVLRAARAQLHQGVGALELVGMPAVADVLRASEAAVQRMVARPALVNAAAVDTVERVSFALLDFMGRQLAGKPVSPVMLFPQYRSALQLAGADRIHPADLWKIDWQWRELPADSTAVARPSDDDARGAMETLVLALMREPGGEAARGALVRMSDLCAGLGAAARASARGTPSHPATFWQIAAAVFQAQAAGLLTPDAYTKRLGSRLLSQLRAQVRGEGQPSDRLAQDLLFFCSHAAAPTAELPAPRLEAVRRAWQLDRLPSADYETPRLGRFDPALMATAKKRVGAAKDSWSAVAGGELHRMGALAEQFTLVGDSLSRIFPTGDVLAAALQAAVSQTVESEVEPPPALAMEVATGILYLDASLEDGEFDHPELAQRVRRLASRIDEVRGGAEPQPLDAWMEELYRRVSDHQTMGSVVQELRASLSEIEKQIDQYFRDPTQRQLLIPVPAQLSSMRGVLSVLGLEQASQAVLHMRDDVDALAQTEVDPQRAIQAGTFDRLADNLGALSFLIDMLSVQPALAKSLFRFDPETGSLSAVMGQTERVSAFAAFDEVAAPQAAPAAAPSGAPLLEQLRSLAAAAARPGVGDDEIARRLQPLVQLAEASAQPDLAQLLAGARSALAADGDAALRSQVRAELVEAVTALTGPPRSSTPAPIAPVASPAAPDGSGLEDDAEMREIFIEEVGEVIAQARSALDRLAQTPDDAAEMTVVRRAFHTLKGSARMIGLRDFGEAGWACEQLYNDRLAQAPRMDDTLREFTAGALDYLADWAAAIAAEVPRGHVAADVARAADALRVDGTLLPIPAPKGGVAPSVASVGAHADAETTQTLPRLDSGLATPFGDPADDVEKTVTLPPRAAPPRDAPAPLDLLDLDFEPPAADAAQEAARAIVVQTLKARVPELPSASDLELATGRIEVLGSDPVAPGASANAPASELSFDLDLEDLDTPGPDAASGSPAVPADDLFDLPLDAPVPAASALHLPEGEALEIELDDLDAVFATGAPVPSAPEPRQDAAAPPAAPAPAEIDDVASEGASSDDEQVKVIGPLRISIPLFNIYLNEADELSRRLATELAEWALEHERHAVPASSVALAHSLAGNSATVGYADLSSLARALEHALMRSHAAGRGREGEPALFSDAAEEIRRLLHQFAAGFLRPVEPGLMERLAAHERLPVELTAAPESVLDLESLLPDDADADAAHEGASAPPGHPGASAPPGGAAGATADVVDPQLFPFFEEEADELLPQLQNHLRRWADHPGEFDDAMACMRTLHTVKGGARLAGAMGLGEMAHELETAIEQRVARGDLEAADIETLLARADAMSAAFDRLRKRAAAAAQALAAPAAPPPAPAAALPPEPQVPPLAPTEPLLLSLPGAAAAGLTAGRAEAANELHAEGPDGRAAPPAVEPGPEPVPPIPETAAALAPVATDEPPAPRRAGPAPPTIDWQRFAAAGTGPVAAVADRPAPGGGVVRVRSGLLDRLVNQAGEVSITRSRMDSHVGQMQTSLAELTDSLERMRRQLRDIEVQAETQINSRLEAAKAASQSFDPLEMDRYTRLQELTRFMAESVNDVATLQRGLQRTVQATEDELAAQARLTRELQDDLLRTRMIEFESLAERLHRTVRQAAKDTGKQARLAIVGAGIEIDRGVLERMAGPFEHLLRNSVAHGIEPPEARALAGKDATGLITVTLAQTGNEVAIEFADDGAGLDLARIRARGVERGLLAAEAEPGDAALAQLIFQPGFSTADAVTELAGRGVGLDVVRAEVNAMGGRIETGSEPGLGTRFRLLLPLTTAVTQVVMLRCGDLQVAVPSTLIEVVKRVPVAEVTGAYASGSHAHAGQEVPFFWLAALLLAGGRGEASGRTQPVVIVRSAAQRVAVHVDEVVGNQEVVVKNVGPQLSRMPGLAGVTLLPSGAVALIYNPVALASVYGDAARARMRGAAQPDAVVALAPVAAPALAPTVLVVDDSLTVRRVTQRLLVREGYRVVTAKDGLDALERLAEERPAVMLSDIEMPRMDGFDLLRNVRADARLAGLPVVMITSRIAQKHRDYAAELGVDHYLGKPYAEEELLALVAKYAAAAGAPDQAPLTTP